MSNTRQNASNDPGSPFRLTTLGSAALLRRGTDGVDVPLLGAGKPLALLAYLAAAPGRAAGREHLVDLLWADADAKSGDHAFRQTVYALKRLLGEDSFEALPGRLVLTQSLPFDRAEFIQVIEQGNFELAVTLYQGEFFPAFSTRGSKSFEQWVDVERLRLRLMFVQAAEACARQWLSSGRFRDAQRLAHRVRSADPQDERGWRLLLETLVSGGDMLSAGVEAADLSRMLAEEERDPEPSTRALLDIAGQDVPTGMPPDPAKRFVSELIGREREFSGVGRAWEAVRGGSGRHLHITAAAGIGKTRLLGDAHGRLRATGARVVSVRANGGERRIAYACAAELATRICQLPGATGVSSSSAGILVGLSPVLSSLFRASADMKGSPDELLRRRAAAVCEAACAVAEDVPLAVLVDDVHWADPASRQILQALAEKLPECRALLVTASRPAPEGDLRATDTETFSLEPLSVAQTGTLVASIGTLPEEPWAATLPLALHATTRGSPLLMLEILQALCERGILALAEPGWACSVPDALARELSVGSAFRTRIAQLERHESWLLVLLAAAGAPLALEVLVGPAGRPVEAVQGDLARMEQRGLLQRAGQDWEPSHDEIAALALDVAGDTAVCAAHAALGKSLAASVDAAVDSLIRAGQHLVAAGKDEDLPFLLRRAVLAARRSQDARRPHELAHQMLGEDADDRQVSRLVGALPVGVRWRLGPVAGIAAAIVGTVLATFLVTSYAMRRAPRPDAVLLAISIDSGGSRSALVVPVMRDGWPPLPNVDLRVTGTAYKDSLPPIGTYDWSLSPDGEAWAYSKAVPPPDSGGNEVFIQRRGQPVRRVTFQRGDDVHPSWSPDGRSLAFATDRWNRHSWADIAAIDLVSGRVRQLTRGDPIDEVPRWSPDGSRIAFRRNWPTHTGLCWVSVDAARERCLTTPKDGEVGSILGWLDASQILIQVTAPAPRPIRLVRIDADRDTGTVVASDSVMGDMFMSPDGRWVSCLCQSAGSRHPTWRVFQLDNVDRVAAVRTSEAAGTSLRVLWLAGRRPQAPLDHIVIAEPSSSVPLGTTYRLLLHGLDSLSVEVPVRGITWRSADTSIAVVNESTGVVSPRKRGTVRLEATSGGWRSGSVQLAIEDRQDNLVFREQWADGVERQWVPFGEPRPFLITGSAGVAGLNPNGDGNFESGAYTRSAFDARRGLGVEARVSTPLNSEQYQRIAMSLFSGMDSVGRSRWDHRTGYPSIYDPTKGGIWCYAAYPAVEGDAPHAKIRAGGDVEAPPWMRSGGWYTLRLQVFPDGTCGVAVNGRPLTRARFTGSGPFTTDSLRALIEGNSVGTTVLFGPMEVWQGVRGGVDWSLLERHR